MKQLAPHIFRKRMVIEGIHQTEITAPFLQQTMHDISELLEMRIIIGPIVKDLAGEINPIHKGYEAIMVWAESGAQLYTWEDSKFFTLDVYTCKDFETDVLLNFITVKMCATQLEAFDVGALMDRHRQRGPLDEVA